MKQDSNADAYNQQVSIRVNFEYSVKFTRSVFSIDNPVLIETIGLNQPGSYRQLAVYIDDNVANAWPDINRLIKCYVDKYADFMTLCHEPVIIPGGEVGKNMDTVELLHQHMLKGGLDRQSYVIAIGGGSALDTIGYAASTFHRGTRLIRLPTTVLAQNDAGIGVKNGVNAYGMKNLLGTFSPPYAVINDSNFLNTLTVRDRRAGIAEAIKVAVIRDKVFFEWIEAHVAEFADVESEAINVLIQRCSQLHIEQIQDGGDPFEMGSARPLDYGHWSAHKIELLSCYQLNHGEAVAIGMALDALYATTAGFIDKPAALRLVRLLQKIGFTLWHECMDYTNEAGESSFLLGLEEFRQHLGGALCVTILTGIGSSVEVNQMDKQDILQARNWLKMLSCN